MCILKKIAIIQNELMAMDIPKSGYNKFSKFQYHELEDLLPPINKKCFEHELILVFDFTFEKAILRVTNWNDIKDYVEYTVPMPEIGPLNKGMNIMQSEGSYITYLKKYLLVNAFLIMEKSTVELTPGQEEPQENTVKSTQKSKPPVNPKCPNSIKNAIKRVKHKGVPITKQSVYACVNWKQISDEEKEAAKAYINNMEA